MHFRIGRRGFLRTSAAGATGLLLGTQLSGCNGGGFLHGVASGDPRHDAVVLWTRVTPTEPGEVPVLWEVASDEAFRRRVAVGIVVTDESADYTVKVDVHGLRPGKTYYYRFRTSEETSPVGRTRTLPSGHVESFRLGVVSCAHFIQGYFHVYRELSLREDLDLVVHLGDYIYESGNSASLGIREVSPDRELVQLADYRQRYAHYRSDPDVQAVHARHPFALVWDDHEVANNAWRDGAAGHSEAEGDYAARRAAAFQAYYEWLPIREPVDGDRERLYRSLDVGDLLSLHVLDTRHFARAQSLDIVEYVDLSTGALDDTRFFADLSAPRELLGGEQRAWLEGGLSSGATWQVVGQQILVAPMWLPAPVALRQLTFAQYAALLALAQTNPDALTPAQQRMLAAPNIPYNLDAWDGYPAEQRWLLDTARDLDVNLVVLSGDTHNAWASDLQSSEGTAAGVELACPSVSSRGLEELLPGQDPDFVAQGALATIPNLRFAETAHRGFLVVTFTHERASAVWSFVDNVKTEDYQPLPDRERRLYVLPGPEQRKLMSEA